MSSLRRVRRNFRKAVLQLIEAGEGNSEKLMKLADEFYGSNDCGYKSVLKAFHQSEINNAASQLRIEGLVETVGKSWKSIEKLEQSDIDVITIRRMKRLRGEAKSLVGFAHNYGRTEIATTAANVASIFSARDEETVAEHSSTAS